MGSLQHRPNHLALLRFLSSEWGEVRKVLPDVRLAVAGRVQPELAAQLSAYEGVDVRGFVEDSAEFLRQAKVAILPFESSGGSSLRVLYFALAGIPLVGSPLALRGFPPELGDVASQPHEWTGLLREMLEQSDGQATKQAGERRRFAEALHADAEPWERLASLL
jgi:hypothetical protein